MPRCQKNIIAKNGKARLCPNDSKKGGNHCHKHAQYHFSQDGGGFDASAILKQQESQQVVTGFNVAAELDRLEEQPRGFLAKFFGGADQTRQIGGDSVDNYRRAIGELKSTVDQICLFKGINNPTDARRLAELNKKATLLATGVGKLYNEIGLSTQTMRRELMKITQQAEQMRAHLRKIDTTSSDTRLQQLITQLDADHQRKKDSLMQKANATLQKERDEMQKIRNGLTQLEQREGSLKSQLESFNLKLNDTQQQSQFQQQQSRLPFSKQTRAPPQVQPLSMMNRPNNNVSTGSTGSLASTNSK